MEIIEEILKQYNLTETKPVVLLRESSDNVVYVVGEKNKKILRLSKHIAPENLSFESQVSDFLRENDFPVAKWLKTKTGSSYYSSKNVKAAVIFDYIDGYHVKVDKQNIPTKDQAYMAGTVLGRLHNIGTGFISQHPRERTIFSELKRVIKNQEVFLSSFNGGVDFVNQVKEAIAYGEFNSNSYFSLIHNDFRSGNIFFGKNHTIAGIIDFDWSCIGPQVKDLALAVLEWSFPDGTSEPNQDAFNSFLSGYNSECNQKVSKGEILYRWIMFSALSDASTFFCDRLSSPDLKRNITNSYMYQKYLYFKKLVSRKSI